MVIPYQSHPPRAFLVHCIPNGHSLPISSPKSLFGSLHSQWPFPVALNQSKVSQLFESSSKSCTLLYKFAFTFSTIRQGTCSCEEGKHISLQWSPSTQAICCAIHWLKAGTKGHAQVYQPWFHRVHEQANDRHISLLWPAVHLVSASCAWSKCNALLQNMAIHHLRI